jgi:hypothetical protein
MVLVRIPLILITNTNTNSSSSSNNQNRATSKSKNKISGRHRSGHQGASRAGKNEERRSKKPQWSNGGGGY